MWQILSRWDENLKLEKKEKVKTLLDDGNLIFFFNKDDEYYGGPEESRLVFAKLKNPDEDVTPAWNDEAAFIAYNLSKMLNITSDTEAEESKRLFYKKDMEDVKILDKETLVKLLLGGK